MDKHDSLASLHPNCELSYYQCALLHGDQLVIEENQHKKRMLCHYSGD